MTRAELMNCPVDCDDAAEATLTHPKLIPCKDSGTNTPALEKAVLKKAVFESYMSTAR